MRDDITRIADAYGGTRANILRLAVPPRVARIDGEQQLAARSLWVGRLRFSHVSDELMQRCFDTIQASYDGAAMLRSSLEGSSFAALVMDARPGARAWARDAAWMIAAAMRQNRAAVVVLPGIRQCEDLAVALEGLGLSRFAPGGAEHGGYSGDFVVLAAGLPPADRSGRVRHRTACRHVCSGRGAGPVHDSG